MGSSVISSRANRIQDGLDWQRASWIESQGLALSIVIPLLFAAFVVIHCASYGK